MTETAAHADRETRPNEDDGAAGNRWLRHAQLAFLGFFFIRFAFPPVATWEYVANGIGLAFFLFCYFNFEWVCERPSSWPVTGMIASGVLLAPINSGAHVFLIFAAYAIAVSRPARPAWTGVLGVLGLVAVTALTVNPHWSFWLPACVVIPGVAGLAQRDRREARIRAELAASRGEVQRLAREAERERIARDLHDVLGHTLSLITLKSELAGKLLHSDVDAAAREIAEIEAVSRNAMAEVRDTMKGYRHIDLDAELDALEAALATSGVALERDVEPLDLDARQQTVVALLLREAVTNVIRHADARVCRIRVAAMPDGVEVSVSDDGDGFAGREGNGVRGMRERLAEIGGHLTVSGGDGTQVIARLPASA